MSLNYNRVMLAGNLTRDPEIKYLTNENAVTNFGLAINRRYKSGGETKEEVTFVDVEAWGKTAENCSQYLTKGRPVFIEGRIKLETWEDKTSGQKRSKLKVVADSVQFLGGKNDKESDEAPEPARAAPQKPAPVAAKDDDSEPPF